MSPFTHLKEIGFDDILLQVEVSAARNFTLQNDFGVIDTTKPFLPFGPMPKKSSSLILGSQELFSKKLDSITLEVSWAEAYNDADFFLKKSPDDYQLSFRYLKQGAWQGDGSDYSLQLFGPAYAGSRYEPPPTVSQATEPAALAKQQAPAKAIQVDTQARSIREETPSDLFDLFAPPANSIALDELDSISFGLDQTMDNQPYVAASSSGFIRLSLSQELRP